MKTIYADTNVFLRFLTNDIPAQSEKVERRFKQAQSGKFAIVVLHITIIEILFHLERWYKLSKKEATEKLAQLLSPSWITTDHKDAVFEALQLYTEKNIDFVDLLTWNITKEAKTKLLSFDKDFDKLSPNLRLKP